MDGNDRMDFAATMTLLAATYGQEFSPQALDGYWLALREYGLDQVRGAVEQAIKTLRWLPKPAELRDIIAPPGSWALAWEAIMIDHGETTDPIGAQALRVLGGWSLVGYTDFSKLPTLRAQFRDAYEALAESARLNPNLALPAPPAGGKRIHGPRPVARLLDRFKR